MFVNKDKIIDLKQAYEDLIKSGIVPSDYWLFEKYILTDPDIEIVSAEFENSKMVFDLLELEKFPKNCSFEKVINFFESLIEQKLSSKEGISLKISFPESIHFENICFYVDKLSETDVNEELLKVLEEVLLDKVIWECKGMLSLDIKENKAVAKIKQKPDKIMFAIDSDSIIITIINYNLLLEFKVLDSLDEKPLLWASSGFSPQDLAALQFKWEGLDSIPQIVSLFEEYGLKDNKKEELESKLKEIVGYIDDLPNKSLIELEIAKVNALLS